MKCLSVALAILFTACALYGVDYTNISDKSYISGPAINPEKLEGKVVFFEYWGRNCGPCLASLPHLQELWEKYGKTGKFIVIGSHCQSRDDADVKKRLAEAHVTFPVYQFIYNSLAKPNGGVPFAALINHKGELVKSGHPSSMYKLVPDLVKNAPDIHFIFGSSENASAQAKSLARTFIDGKNVEKAFDALRKKAAENSDAGKEAQVMLKKAETWKTEKTESLKKTIKDTPAGAITEIIKYKIMFPSDKSFDNELANLKANKNVTVMSQIRRNFESEEARYRKKAKPSKAQSKRFEAFIEALGKIEDPALQNEISVLTTRIDALAKESAPEN